MPNGKPGDHPYTDIVVHGLRVYSESVDRLVREVDELSDERGRRELSEILLSEYSSQADITKLERVLTQRRDELRSAAKQRGWES